MTTLRALLLALLPFAAGCALKAPPAESFLGGSGAADAGVARDQAQLDADAQRALAASKAKPDDADLAIAATTRLFVAADLRLQHGSVVALDAIESPQLGTVLFADDQVADAVRTEILSLCTAGLDAAERAAVARPHDAAVLLHKALHLSLIAWANGPARSLFAGYGPKLVDAIDAALNADSSFDHGAPLRLQGRFRGRAPWPYGDLVVARAALQHAVELAPIAVNRLFYGDVLWAADQRAAAKEQWVAATTANGDDSTRWSTPLLQELAKRRLAALARMGQ